MKKIIYMFITTLLLTGCGLISVTPTYDWEIPEEINTKMDIDALMLSPKYNYEPDPKGRDVWNYPHQTYNGTTIGNDCEDTAILYVYLYYVCLGENNVKLVGLQGIDNPEKFHMIFYVNGVYYQSTGRMRGYPVMPNYIGGKYEIINTWDYEQMIRAIRHRN